jgi:hypothetical protein
VQNGDDRFLTTIICTGEADDKIPYAFLSYG